MNEDEKHDILKTLAELGVIMLILIVIPYALSGLWPPFVSVVSGSMSPNINVGDMVLVADNERYDDENDIHGIETRQTAEEMDFNRRGDVIVFRPDGEQTTPVIHRAVLYTEKDENWVKEADDLYLDGNTCEKVSNCPAPHSGFITLGDNNELYDQEMGISEPVKEEWIYGKAMYRIPYLGWIRILISSVL